MSVKLKKLILLLILDIKYVIDGVGFKFCGSN